MNKDYSSIIPNGSKVVTNIGNIEALVIGVCIRGESNSDVEYNIAYFLNGERQTHWVYDYEVTQKIDNSKPMGFGAREDSVLKIDKP